jgi:hypothetical protein
MSRQKDKEQDKKKDKVQKRPTDNAKLAGNSPPSSPHIDVKKASSTRSLFIFFLSIVLLVRC